MFGLWVEKDGHGRWHRIGDRIHLADTVEKVREVLKDGFDNSFSYTPKLFDGSEAVQPERAMLPHEPKRDFKRGLVIRFRTDYAPNKGIKAEPGDAFFTPCFRGVDGSLPCGHWDNCDGKHLHIVCPDGRWWNVDGRAGNCTKPEDRNHRCWVRHGDPAEGTLTIDKNGPTCEAGAGSIDTGTYHGHVRDGHFDP